MKRSKHKVKTETPEPSASTKLEEVHDLTYYIHDRVEMVHQVFSVMKYKELKSILPASIRNISIDDLQELCTEEVWYFNNIIFESFVFIGATILLSIMTSCLVYCKILMKKLLMTS